MPNSIKQLQVQQNPPAVMLCLQHILTSVAEPPPPQKLEKEVLTPSLLTTPANAIFLIRNSCYPLNQSSFTQWQFNYILLYPHSGKWLYYFHQPRSLQCNSRWKNNQKPNYSTWRSMNFSVCHCFVCQFRFSVQKFYRLLFMVTFEPVTHSSVIFVVRNTALFITTGNIYVSLKVLLMLKQALWHVSHWRCSRVHCCASTARAAPARWGKD